MPNERQCTEPSQRCADKPRYVESSASLTSRASNGQKTQKRKFTEDDDNEESAPDEINSKTASPKKRKISSSHPTPTTAQNYIQSSDHKSTAHNASSKPSSNKAIYSTHTKFVDESDEQEHLTSNTTRHIETTNDPKRPSDITTTTTIQRVDSLARFGRSNDNSGFNNLFWTPKAILQAPNPGSSTHSNTNPDTTHPDPASPSPANRKSKFRWASLPYEIRHEIYTYLFTRSNSPSAQRKKTPKQKNKKKQKQTKPALLKALHNEFSMPLYHEAVEAYHQLRTFTINVAHQENYEGKIDPTLIPQIRNVTLMIPRLSPLTPLAPIVYDLAKTTRYLKLKVRDRVDLMVFLQKMLHRFVALRRLEVETFTAGAWTVRRLLEGQRYDPKAASCWVEWLDGVMEVVGTVEGEREVVVVGTRTVEGEVTGTRKVQEVTGVRVEGTDDDYHHARRTKWVWCVKNGGREQLLRVREKEAHVRF